MVMSSDFLPFGHPGIPVQGPVVSHGEALNRPAMYQSDLVTEGSTDRGMFQSKFRKAKIQHLKTKD